MWIESGITNWQKYRSAATTSPSDYGAANGTSSGRTLKNAKPGDIVVWGPLGHHVGHVGLITRVYENGRINYMSGNHFNKTVLLKNQDPVVSSSWLGPYDDIVAPRL